MALTRDSALLSMVLIPATESIPDEGERKILIKALAIHGTCKQGILQGHASATCIYRQLYQFKN